MSARVRQAFWGRVAGGDVTRRLATVVTAAAIGCSHTDPTGIVAQTAGVRVGQAARIVAATPPTAAEWESLRGLAGLRELVLDRGVADDGRVEILTTLPDLERLVLRESPLTDTGFRQLAACTKLRDLNIPQAACTAGGIRALSGLEHLRSLRIGGRALAGADVCAAVAELPALYTLHLIDVPIGDGGLRVLARLPRLWSLYLDGAGVSDDAWEGYFQACPHVHVHVDQAHHDRDPHRGHD
jgi:hypothetical protein